ETYAGDAWHPPTTMNPDIRFLPMPCQQCGNAPCEYVCPVFATYHTDEGLNAQVYNRCIGTRYCSNNCIYKVRRFNWYTPIWPKPLDQQLNPAVIVRAKGVMEKCTFCVQRIEQAELRAKAEGRPLRDGEVQTACMQTCPTEAIVFGDLKDPNSRVSQLHQQDRGYRLFWEENTFPAVTYLKRTKFVLNGLNGKADGEPPI
ncbi:MAG: 4Fe-4S dicluster domain-containing protein, partial [Terriglobales bacterium]